MVGWESAGPDLQLEGRGDVEKATDGWLEAQGPGRAWALQEEGLQDGGDQEEEFCSSQALPEADTLTWRGQGDMGLGQPSSHPGPRKEEGGWAGPGGRYLRRRARMPPAF